MFIVLSIVLVYALLTFGAVLPYSWFVLAGLWGAGTAGLVIARKGLDLRHLAFIACVLGLAVVAGVKVAVVFIALGWAWLAASQDPEGVLSFFRFLIVVGVLEAALGLTQYFFETTWLFGYQTAGTAGTLINRNHFAGLLEMLIPVAFGFSYMAAHQKDAARSYVYLLLAAIMGLALMFSVSRMGIFSFLVTLMFLALIIRLRESQRKLIAGLGFGLLALVVSGTLWIGIDVIVDRYELLLEEDSLLRDGRAIVYRDTAQMIAAHPWGVGIGQYRDRFREYQTYRPDLLFDHAHNDYLETAAEWGILPAILFWAFLFYVLHRAVKGFFEGKSPVKRGILLACCGSMFAIFVHSMTDFNLQIPSNAILFLSLSGIALGASRKRSAPERIARAT